MNFFIFFFLLGLYLVLLNLDRYFLELEKGDKLDDKGFFKFGLDVGMDSIFKFGSIR